MEFVIAGGSIVVALFWIQQGWFRYGFWVKGTPGGGFLPVIFGLIILVSSIVVMLRARKAPGVSGAMTRSSFIPIGFAVIGVGLIQAFGISLAVFVFTLVWMKFLSRYSWLKSILVSAVFTGFIYGIFRLWLQVPFPPGLFSSL